MAALKLSPILASLLTLSTALDTISPSHPVNDDQTLTSSSGVFQLGFFSPGNSSFRYLGIWYNNNISPRRFVWVANRKSPITTTTGVLHLTPSGNLAISDNTKTLIWSTNTTSSTSVQLLDSGNLVVSSGSSILWQSFDHPTDTLLPGMKLGRDFITKIQWTLSSWTSDSDPSPGRYTFTVYVQNHRPPEAYMMNGSTPIWRSGIWVGDGDGWNGVPAMTANAYMDYNLINNATTVYYSLEMKSHSSESMLVLDQNGVIQRLLWLGTGWNNNWNIPADPCDSYGICGNFGVCHNSGTPTGAPIINCECLRGFVRESDTELAGGCKRKVELGCGKADVFVMVEHMKLPDTVNAISDSGKRIDECRDWCLGNCSCLGYVVTSVEGGGCINWFGHLMDVRDFSGRSDGEVIYLRLAASELAVVGTNGTLSTEKNSHSKKSSAVIITTAVVSGMILVSVALFTVYMRQQKAQRKPKQPRSSTASTSHLVTEDSDSCDLSNIVTKDNKLPLFPFSVLETSTNNFSNETKIGEGGFGPVHKGTLPNGQQIAVKRLSKHSGQGVDEFKNEIKLIANLQHKNLVRLLGCSIKDSERLLVYEYMANGSLDKFLFGPIKAVHLDWKRRIGIIDGIAQGLLYLHKYSRLRIIHRDLKCSNILLDADMNPKISDFGIARIFGGNQDHANTLRVVGTYGYMSPEYAIRGLFSEKSDVFSYGVLLLEVISGKKNSDFDQVGGLLGRAWELWNNRRASELMDPVLGQSCRLPELSRCVQIGLLCVQEEPEKRPTMSSVVSFLNSDTTALPPPKNIAFITSRGINASSSSGESYDTQNEVTITAAEPR